MDKAFFSRFGNYLLAFVFICLISYQVAGVIYKIVDLVLASRTSPALSLSIKGPNFKGKSESSELNKIIVEKNLFGAASVPLAASGEMSIAGKEDTSHRWELKGTIVFNRFVGYAILSEKSKGNQRLVGTGKKIENATLVRVGRDFCILEEGGKQFVLRTSGAKLSPLLPAEGITIPRKEVMAHISNLGQMFSEARIVPYVVDGNPAGFQLVQITPGSLFQKMGLMPGDVVQEVNDRRITGAEDVTQLFQALQTSASMSITVLRAGKTERLNYQFI